MVLSIPISTLIQYTSTALLVLSASYLVWRTLSQVVVQRRSYRQLPFGKPEPLEAGEDSVDCARAAMLGFALGDALGMPRESLPVWFANLRFGRSASLSRGIVRFMRRRGTISDDTQLTVSTARSVDDDGSYDAQRFQQQLSRWIRYAIGPGRATMQAARGWRRGEDRRDFDSQGNGAAMRVVPLAIAFGGDPERAIEAVRLNAAATHPNAEAIAGAESMARIVMWLLELDGASSVDAGALVDTALPRTTSEELEDWEARLGSAVSRNADNGGLAAVGTTGWVKQTVPAVAYLLIHHAHDTEGALAELWACGGDIDTIAALYLACVGAWKGTRVFDAQPIDSLQGAAVLADEASRLAAISHEAGKPSIPA